MILYLVVLLPVLLFILMLLWFDSFSLVKKEWLVVIFCLGAISAWSAEWFSIYAMQLIPMGIAVPMSEELLKGMVVLWIIKSRKSAFFIDSAIYGAASGAGFAFLENLLYVNTIPDMLLGTAVMRGCGTAIMHCGTVAITASILHYFIQKYNHTLLFFPIALLPGIAIHALFNALIIPPALALVIILMGISGALLGLFFWDERHVRQWIDMELDNEVKLLSAIRCGEFSATKAGKYLLSVKNKFEPECFFDMLCYLRIYIELSLQAKARLMLQEADLTPVPDCDKSEKVREFLLLRKRIGRIALIVLSPLIKQSNITEVLIRRNGTILSKK